MEEISYTALGYLYDVLMYIFSPSQHSFNVLIFSRQTYKSLDVEACTGIYITPANSGNEAVMESFYFAMRSQTKCINKLTKWDYGGMLHYSLVNPHYSAYITTLEYVNGDDRFKRRSITRQFTLVSDKVAITGIPVNCLGAWLKKRANCHSSCIHMSVCRDSA